MLLSKALILAALSYKNLWIPDGIVKGTTIDMSKNAETGEVSLSYQTVPGATQGEFIVSDADVFVIKPSDAMKKIGIKLNDRLLSSCGIDLTLASLDTNAKGAAITLGSKECELKVRRKGQELRFTYRPES